MNKMIDEDQFIDMLQKQQNQVKSAYQMAPFNKFINNQDNDTL